MVKCGIREMRPWNERLNGEPKYTGKTCEETLKILSDLKTQEERTIGSSLYKVVEFRYARCPIHGDTKLLSKVTTVGENGKVIRVNTSPRSAGQ